MSVFVIGYYTLLLAVSCLAAYFNKRQVFLLAFSLTALVVAELQEWDIAFAALGQGKVLISGTADTDFVLQLFDPSGKELLRKEARTGMDGGIVLNWEESLVTGIYLARLEAEGRMKGFKIYLR